MTPVSPDARFSTWQDGGFRNGSWGHTIRAAERAAVGLRRLGVEPGVRVGCVLTNSFDVCAGLLGIWLAGGMVVSLPTPARGVDIGNYLAQLTALCDRAGISLLLVEQDGGALESLSGGLRVVSFSGLAAPGRLDPQPPADDEPAFVQFSSGTTSRPKGCVLTPRAIAAQIAMAIERWAIEPEHDRLMTWLPLSHDMGLVGGLLTPWASGVPVMMGTPLRFMRSPRTWLEDCAASGATLTGGPGFGLTLAVRAARRSPPPAGLRVRSWVVGSDQIEADMLAEAAAVLGRRGIPPTAFSPAYGLAEATLAVTMVRAEAEPRAVSISLDAMYDMEVRETSATDAGRTTRVVSTGPPMSGVTVRIDGPDAIGEIVLRSPSRASGYLDEPELSKLTFSDGELRTGDLGFMRDGELFVIGREDDMLSLGGRKIHARELESRLCREHPVRPGCCALIDVHEGGHRRLVVVSEPTHEDMDFSATARAMRRSAVLEYGVAINECVFMRRGRLPKSPTGKVQRFRCRQLVNEEEALLARVRVG